MALILSCLSLRLQPCSALLIPTFHSLFPPSKSRLAKTRERPEFFRPPCICAGCFARAPRVGRPWNGMALLFAVQRGLEMGAHRETLIAAGIPPEVVCGIDPAMERAFFLIIKEGPVTSRNPRNRGEALASRRSAPRATSLLAPGLSMPGGPCRRRAIARQARPRILRNQESRRALQNFRQFWTAIEGPSPAAPLQATLLQVLRLLRSTAAAIAKAWRSLSPQPSAGSRGLE